MTGAMRLKKGSKVEVLITKGIPSGSWLPAEVIAGNGHYYSVQYDHEPLVAGATTVGKVPRILLRPPPPPMMCSGDWEPGDVVEMFGHGVWKPAEVSKVAGEGYFLVQLVGCSEMCKVHCSNLRTRQVWQNNQWRVMGKECGLETERNFNRRGPDFEQIVVEANHGHPCKRKLHVASSYSVKKVPAIGHLPAQGNYHAIKKQRMVHKDGTQWRLPEDNFLLLPEKVVVISSPKNKLGGKYMFTSHSNRSRRSAMESDKRNSSAGFPWRSLEPDKAECDELSTCSSSGSNRMNLLYHYPLAGCHLDLYEHSDDAHSCTESTTKRQTMTLACGDMSAEIHKLELHAYRSTLEALYASGPMSWEQEALITNLRLMLHISNDEHLFELRNLTSRESNAACS